MTFIAVVALLIHLNWWLGLITGAVFAPVVPVCLRFEKRYRVLSRQVQDQQGDLATLIEEAATGHPRAEGARPRPAGRRPARRPGHGGLPDAGREGRPARLLLGRCST